MEDTFNPGAIASVRILTNSAKTLLKMGGAYLSSISSTLLALLSCSVFAHREGGTSPDMRECVWMMAGRAPSVLAASMAFCTVSSVKDCIGFSEDVLASFLTHRLANVGGCRKRVIYLRFSGRIAAILFVCARLELRTVRGMTCCDCDCNLCDGAARTFVARLFKLGVRVMLKRERNFRQERPVWCWKWLAGCGILR